ncbi:uncharacterized protein LOC131152234 isoform X2 [Malania oleifera]|uniref:uncharacterized protein LOC131152234 isoform X2 n=1 Tax=Malania oleifera TaxID=397392 RepID=UPI0025AE8E5E|nr:uncharacterized protein LOC131152234 isoform X2 [Malania oleifera]
MGDLMDSLPSSGSLDLDIVRSRMGDLTDILRSSNEEFELNFSDSEKLLQDCALHLEIKIKEIISEHSYFSSSADEDLDSNQLESNLEGLKYSIDFVASQGVDKAKAGAHDDCSSNEEDPVNSTNVPDDHKFEILELSNQIEKNKITLKSLQDLDCAFKRLDAMEKIQDTLTGVKVIEFDGNSIRLSLSTHILNYEGLLCRQKIEDTIEPSELNHEMLIEVMDGTMQLKKVEIFPNDVYIAGIIDAAKSFSAQRTLYMESRSSLEWFVRKVQDRIVLSAIRRFVVNVANKSRHSLEYLDKDDMIVAHMVGGVDAFIKLSPGWPASNSALKLIYLKSSGHQSKGIPLDFLCKVEEATNSLEMLVRQNISSFVDAIEEILMQQMHLQLHLDDSLGK